MKQNKDQYVGNYIILVKDSYYGKLYEIDLTVGTVQKAIEGIGFTWYKFKEIKDSNGCMGIGLYKIIREKHVDDEDYAYVKFICPISSNQKIDIVGDIESWVFMLLLYSSENVVEIETVFTEISGILTQNNRNEYQFTINLTGYLIDNKVDINNYEIIKLLKNKGCYEEDTPIADLLIRGLEQKRVSREQVILAYSKPTKMRVYARYLLSDDNWNNLKYLFPELYDKLNNQFDTLDYDIEDYLTDYFNRAHKKLIKYSDGEVKEDMDMEQEMRLVLDYEKQRKNAEKELKKKRRLEKKKKNNNNDD